MTRLLNRGAKASNKDGQSNTLLHYAAKKGWTFIAEKLIEHGSKLDATNKKGEIPLELAIHNNRNECATFLIKKMESLR